LVAIALQRLTLTTRWAKLTLTAILGTDNDLQIPLIRQMVKRPGVSLVAMEARQGNDPDNTALCGAMKQSQSAQWLFCFAMFLIVGSISQSAGAAIGAAITVRLFMTHWVQWAVEKGAFEQ
jgi:hypothetical protein